MINYDVLKFNLEKITLKNTIILGNLPYNISTQILLKTISFQKWPPNYEKIIFMFQKKLRKEYMQKKIHLLMEDSQLFQTLDLKLKIILIFQKIVFFQNQKLTQRLFSLSLFLKQNEDIDHLKNLEKITQIFFSNKRKMINKPMKKIFSNYKSVAERLNLPLNVRPSELDKKILLFFSKINLGADYYFFFPTINNFFDLIIANFNLSFNIIKSYSFQCKLSLSYDLSLFSIVVFLS